MWNIEKEAQFQEKTFNQNKVHLCVIFETVNKFILSVCKEIAC